jgi:hypothetical protein
MISKPLPGVGLTALALVSCMVTSLAQSEQITVVPRPDTSQSNLYLWLVKMPSRHHELEEGES